MMMMMQFGIFFRALISGISILEKRDENDIEENNICSDIVVRIEKKKKLHYDEMARQYKSFKKYIF